MASMACPGFFYNPRFRAALGAAVATGLLAAAALLAQQERARRPQFQWPLIKGEFPEARGLTSTFGESRNDRFHNGVDIAGKGDAIRPMAEGVFLYSRYAGDDPFAPMPGPGNSVVIYHGDGWLSGYYHLEQSEDPPRRGVVKRDTVIGVAGNTGHSGGPHLHFFLADRYGLRVINPLEALPRVKDENAPLIGQVALTTPLGQTLISSGREENIRLTKRYPTSVTIIDAGFERYTRRGVYSYSWKLNNSPRQTRQFDAVSLDDSGWLLGGEHIFADVFTDNLYSLGEMEFRDGKNTLVISAQDFNGNRSEAVFDINVDRQY